jgi:mannose-6-phosphate isomerase
MGYEWGKVGPDSLVYQFVADQPGLDPARPYAELWMGDHPSGPSRTESGLRISELGAEHALPYLFKVLSIRKPLSLQAHPDKAQAEALHARDPANYPDANHKPEMGLFITRTLLLYGFRPLAEIATHLSVVPEFSELFDEGTRGAFAAAPSAATLRALFSAFLRAPRAAVAPRAARFAARAASYPGLAGPAAEAARAIAAAFPGDVGAFCPLLLNAVVGDPGRALFIPPRTLHAYIAGDLYEAMALSDNVVRAAMTPKFVDIDALLALLDFAPAAPRWVAPGAPAPAVARYAPPAPEFLLWRIAVPARGAVALPPPAHDAIASVLDGDVALNGRPFARGAAVLLFAGAPIDARSHAGAVVVVASYD